MNHVSNEQGVRESADQDERISNHLAPVTIAGREQPSAEQREDANRGNPSDPPGAVLHHQQDHRFSVTTPRERERNGRTSKELVTDQRPLVLPPYFPLRLTRAPSKCSEPVGVAWCRDRPVTPMPSDRPPCREDTSVAPIEKCHRVGAPYFFEAASWILAANAASVILSASTKPASMMALVASGH